MLRRKNRKIDPKRIMTEEDLAKINAGNFGDSESEVKNYNQVTFMYDVGDEVEVYQLKYIHFFWTKHGVIVKRYAFLSDYDGWGAYYDVQYDNGYISTMVQADDIER